MRVCVTGASGFLGSALARALAASGHEVHALCRPGSDRSALDGVAVTWHLGDVAQPEMLQRFLAGADAVVHAAGRLGQAGVPEAVYRRVNVEGTRNVLSAALASGERPRVLHLSSPGVLGPTAAPASEDAPYAPTNPYERSKADAERIALDFAARGLPVVVARPGFVYGPGDRHVLGLFRAVQRGRFFLVDGGARLCQPTHVDDAVAGMVACLRLGAPGRAYHVVGPRAVSFRELSATIAAALGVTAPRLSLPRWSAMLLATALEAGGRLGRFTPPLSRSGVAFFSEDRVVSWRRASDELGYRPACDVGEGVRQTVAWYRGRAWL